MARVPCKITKTDLDNDRGGTTPGIIVECSDCGETVEVFGQEDSSIRRGLATLREICPTQEKNWYEPEN